MHMSAIAMLETQTLTPWIVTTPTKVKSVETTWPRIPFLLESKEPSNPPHFIGEVSEQT